MNLQSKRTETGGLRTIGFFLLTMALAGGCSHSYGPSTTPLHEAARLNNPQGVKAALSNGGGSVDARDSDNGTPLIEATKTGALDAAKALIDAGASLEAKDKYDYTALHWAAYKGQGSIARLLVDHGADVNALEYTHSTPLHLAANQGYIEVVNILLNKGADVDPKDKDGWTPLQYAARNGSLEIVTALVAKGANLNYRDPKDAKSALTLAREKSRPDVVKFLEGKGAQ